MTTEQSLKEVELEIEREKLKVERLKAWLTGLSIFVPLIVAALSFAFSTLSQAQQARYDFEIKAAEIVLGASSPSAAAAKARALADLFPDQLPADFAESFDSSLYGGPSSEGKKEFLQLMIEYPDHRREIIWLWERLFPGDTWIDDIRTGD